MKYIVGLFTLLRLQVVVSEVDDRKELRVVRADSDRKLNSLRFRGSDPSFKLAKCEGDCDNDSDCIGSLVCFQKDAGGTGIVPGCAGRDFTRNDFCIDPADVGTPQVGPPAPTEPRPAPVPLPTGGNPMSSNSLFSYGADPPASAFPLGMCEGDCDVDADCAGSLICLQRDANDGPVPGCTGSDRSRTDYCISAFGSPPPPAPAPVQQPQNQETLENFKLKLYWEEGYFWQEERFERKWCMRCRGGSCSNGDKIYIEECSERGVQTFDFVFVNEDEILIRLNGFNRCFERANRDIFMRTCDSGNGLQRWTAQSGGFKERRFEITQKGATHLCITQRHHPKADEEVELEPCEQARLGQTSYWNRCTSNSC